MDDYPIQGKLRIRPANFERDLEFVKAHVGKVSKPELKSYPGFDYLKCWYVDFAATPEQWKRLEPELQKRDIVVTMYESPALLDEQPAKRLAPEIPKHKSKYRWIPWAGFALILAGIAAALIGRDFAVVCLCFSGLGLFVALGGGVLVALDEM